MNLWEIGYIIFGVLSGILITAMVIRTKPARTNAMAWLAMSLLIIFSVVFWPMAYIVCLATVITRNSTKADSSAHQSIERSVVHGGVTQLHGVRGDLRINHANSEKNA